MKKAFSLNLIAFAVIALAMPLGIVQAESADQTTVTPIQSAHAQAITPTQIPTDQSLGARKERAKNELYKTRTQFALFASRTHGLIDRLTAKNFDTAQAQAEWTASVSSLDLAKTNLDLFSEIVVSDDPLKKESMTNELNANIAIIQRNLMDARTHLAASIAALKTVLAPTVETQ